MHDKDFVIEKINENILNLLNIDKFILVNGVDKYLPELTELGLINPIEYKNNKNEINMKTTVKSNSNKTQEIQEAQEIQVGKVRKIHFSEINKIKSKRTIINTAVLELKQGECRSFYGNNIKKLKSILHSYVGVIRRRVDLKGREYITRTEYDDSKKPTGVLIYRKK